MSESGTRILYIDDDSSVCRLVQTDLQRRGYVVEIALDGASGLARIAQGGIDVVALDHVMPNQDGLETLTGIRALAEPPLVIYVTAMQDVGVAVAALKAGAADFVVKDAQGEFLPLLQRAIDVAFSAVTLRRAKEVAEAESKRGLLLTQSIVDTIRDPLVMLEHDMTIVTASKAFLTMFGIAEGEARGRDISELGQRQWDVPTLRRLMKKAVWENQVIEGFEIEDSFPGLGRRVFCLNARKISQPGKHAHRLLLVFEDITERKWRERDAVILRDEIAHRIKNNLQIVVSLIGHEARRAGSPCVAGYQAMQSRIGAIARLYDLISQSSSGGAVAVEAYLKEIAKAMSASLVGDASGIEIEVRAEELDIDPDRAVPFGLLVNELGTNAIKHAFPDGTGRIVLSAQQVGGQIELTVADNGVGMKDKYAAKAQEKRGGTDYVAAFVRQLGATVAVSSSEGTGTIVKVRLPVLVVPPGRAERAVA